MQLIYVPHIDYPETTLDEPESKHAVVVMRLKTGDPVQLVDGSGGLYQASILQAHPRHCRLSIIASQQEFEKRSFHLHIAIAPTKNIDRMEWFCEKATEMGIDQITPLLCNRSERKIIKPERLKKIMVSAMKQSLKAYLPQLDPITPFRGFLRQSRTENRFIAHCQPNDKTHLKELITPGSDTLILIGPEGDFSPDEITSAKASGFREVSLGSARLRTETAGIAACHIVNLLNT